MKFQQLSLFCECGQGPALIRGVGLTESHQLLVKWQCGGCGKDVFLIKPLSDCWRECPTPDDIVAAELLQEAIHNTARDGKAFDRTFLKSMGICAGSEREE
jgi:hypothetical protein